jgi:hypothetical protein
MILQASIGLEITEVFLLSTVKFFFAVPLALKQGLSYWQTVITTTSGGLVGIFLFYYLSPGIMKFLNFLYHGIRQILGFNDLRLSYKKKKHFTRRNKFIVKLRGKLGVFGIVAFTPILLSIPLGAILANKYYRHNKLILPFLCASVLTWSLLLTTAFFFNYL